MGKLEFHFRPVILLKKWTESDRKSCAQKLTKDPPDLPIRPTNCREFQQKSSLETAHPANPTLTPQATESQTCNSLPN